MKVEKRTLLSDIPGGPKEVKNIIELPGLSKEEQNKVNEYYEETIAGSYSDLHNQYLHDKKMEKLKRQNRLDKIKNFFKTE